MMTRPSSSPSIRGAAAVVGIGESDYFRHGESPHSEFELTLTAVTAAAQDAGIAVTDIDGFVSFATDKTEPRRLANGLGIREWRWSGLQWGGGGGGGAGAVQQAAAAVAAGFAEAIVVYRGIAQGARRFGQGMVSDFGDTHRKAYGMLSPGHLFATRCMRYMWEKGIDESCQRGVALASYFHAQQNPRAVMYGRPLTDEVHDNSRMIVEPFRLYDCCQENDGAAAMIVTSSSSVERFRPTPVYVVAAAQGGGHRCGGFRDRVYDSEPFATADLELAANRMWQQAGVKPSEVDVVQSYENFTGGVVMSLIEHGLVSVEEANDFLTLENLAAPGGRLPLNTSGGNLAEAYIHGFELQLEAVRQVRGESCNQVPGAHLSLASAGPMVTPTSTILYGSEETL